MAINWERRRRHISAWYALVERCRATLIEGGLTGVDIHGEAGLDLLLSKHTELKDKGEARNARDYVLGRKGNARTLSTLRGTR